MIYLKKILQKDWGGFVGFFMETVSEFMANLRELNGSPDALLTGVERQLNKLDIRFVLVRRPNDSIKIDARVGCFGDEVEEGYIAFFDSDGNMTRHYAISDVPLDHYIEMRGFLGGILENPDLARVIYHDAGMRRSTHRQVGELFVTTNNYDLPPQLTLNQPVHKSPL